MTKSNLSTKTKISQAATGGLLDELNKAQLEAVTHGNGPLLIVAGAGTGKTTVITRRIAWLILEKGLKPADILALTFTDKAATEMEERVDRLLPYGYVELWISTFHSFAERILKQHAIDIGLAGDFRLLDTTAQWLLIRRNLHRFPLSYYKPLGNPTKFIHALITHFSRAKDEMISPQDYLHYVEELKLNRDSEIIINGVAASGETRAAEIARLEEVANAYHLYEQLLLEEDALDFGGLIVKLVELFKTRPQILAKYRSQFKQILVDEFQDTNYAQYELIKQLAAPTNNLTVVADDDQSIFAFRGASVSNVLHFKKDYPQSQEVFLVENYRSTQPILDLAYRFITQNNPYRLEVQLEKTGLSKKLIAETKEKGIIRHLHADNVDAESRLVIDNLLKLKEKRGVSWNDFAILVRANDHAGVFIRALDSAGIPYELITARGLYTTPIVLDLVAYAKLLHDYHESPAFYRLITSPISKLIDHDISSLLYWANRKSWSLYEVARKAGTLGLTAEVVSECNRLVGLIEQHAALSRRAPVSRVLFAVLEDTGYLKDLSTIDSEEHRDAMRHLNQFFRMVSEFEGEEREPTIRNFLTHLQYEIEAGEEGRMAMDPNEGPEAVKILTCHAAKGLEFRYVFIVNLVDKRFPSVQRRDPIEIPDALVKEILTEGDAHLEEERRLFYVACTRAKEGLFFTSADDYGGARKKKLSRFLMELKELDAITLTLPSPLEGEGIGGADIPLKVRGKEGADIPLKVRGKEGADIPLKVRGKEGVMYNPSPPPLTLRGGERLPTQFSFTQLKAFETCPLQYKFAHILKIPVKGRPTFSFGKAIHRTLQKFCELLRQRSTVKQGDLFHQQIPSPSDGRGQGEGGLSVTLDQLLKLYEESWLDDWFESATQKQAYYEKGKALLKLFYEEAAKNPPNPIYLEQFFHLKIDGYTLKGVIDRVDARLDGTLEIIDYKTGASKEIDRIDKDQLYIYQLAAEEVLGGKPSALTYYYVEDGKRVSFLGTSEDLVKLKEKIRGQIEEMRASSFPATPSKEKCRHCDFKDICEFRIL